MKVGNLSLKMSLPSPLLFPFPHIAFKHCASQVLARYFSARKAQRIWEETLKLQPVLARQRPRYSFGLNLVLRYMEWDCALYRAARECSVPEAQAQQIVAEVNWLAFAPLTTASYKLSRLRSADPLPRARWILDLMFRLLFTAPFQREKFPAADEIAFDVTVCPLAEYFGKQGVPELTAWAACSLDHRMAGVWGVTLHREQTIAGGHPRCDFRFRKTPVVWTKKYG
jgi:hypothetical protein